MYAPLYLIFLIFIKIQPWMHSHRNHLYTITPIFRAAPRRGLYKTPGYWVLRKRIVCDLKVFIGSLPKNEWTPCVLLDRTIHDFRDCHAINTEKPYFIIYRLWSQFFVNFIFQSICSTIIRRFTFSISPQFLRLAKLLMQVLKSAVIQKNNNTKDNFPCGI